MYIVIIGLILIALYVLFIRLWHDFIQNLPKITCETCGKKARPSGLIKSNGQYTCEYCEIKDKLSNIYKMGSNTNYLK